MLPLDNAHTSAEDAKCMCCSYMCFSHSPTPNGESERERNASERKNRKFSFSFIFNIIAFLIFSYSYICFRFSHHHEQHCKHMMNMMLFIVLWTLIILLPSHMTGCNEYLLKTKKVFLLACFFLWCSILKDFRRCFSNIKKYFSKNLAWKLNLKQQVANSSTICSIKQ